MSYYPEGSQYYLNIYLVQLKVLSLSLSLWLCLCIVHSCRRVVHHLTKWVGTRAIRTRMVWSGSTRANWIRPSKQLQCKNALKFFRVFFSLLWTFKAALELKACLCPTFILVWAFKSYLQTSFWKVHILHFSCYFSLDWKSDFCRAHRGGGRLTDPNCVRPSVRCPSVTLIKSWITLQPQACLGPNLVGSYSFRTSMQWWGQRST